MPQNKTSRPLTRPVDPIVGQLIGAWKHVRPPQPKIVDRKTGHKHFSSTRHYAAIPQRKLTAAYHEARRPFYLPKESSAGRLLDLKTASARHRESGSDNGVSSEDVGAAQRGGGEPLVGAGANHRRAKARVFVDEIPVAPAPVVAATADQRLLLKETDASEMVAERQDVLLRPIGRFCV